jgi:hypothetical protein
MNNLSGGIVSAESFLSSAIEIAVGIGGFAGIIAAIRQRNVSHWPPNQRLMLRMLLTASAVAVLFSLAPWLLAEGGLPQPVVWRLCSGSLLVWQSGITVYRRRQFRNLGTSVSVPRLLYILLAVNLALQAINLVLAEAWPFLLGVVSVLAYGFTFFLKLLFWGAGDGDEAA